MRLSRIGLLFLPVFALGVSTPVPLSFLAIVATPLLTVSLPNQLDFPVTASVLPAVYSLPSKTMKFQKLGLTTIVTLLTLLSIPSNLVGAILRLPESSSLNATEIGNPITGKTAQERRREAELFIINKTYRAFFKSLSTPALLGVAATYAELGQKEEALEIISQALERTQSINDSSRRGWLLNEIVRAYITLGEFDKALQVTQLIENLSRKAEALENIIKAYAAAGQTEQLLKLLSQIIQISQPFENIPGRTLMLDRPFEQVFALVDIAKIYQATGHIQQAMELLSQAVRVVQSLENRNNEASEDTSAGALSAIARAYAEMGQTEQALKLLSRAVQVTQSLKDGDNKASDITDIAYKKAGDLNAIAKVYAEIGQREQSLQLLSQAFQVGISLRRTNSRDSDKNYILKQIVSNFAAIGQVDKAYQFTQSIEDTSIKAEILGQIVEEYITANEIEEALRVVEEASKIIQSIENASIKADKLKLIAGHLRRAGQTKKALQIIQSIENASIKAYELRLIAESLRRAGQTEQTLAILFQALQAALSIEEDDRKKTRNISRLKVDIVRTYLAMGETDQALQIGKSIDDIDARAIALSSIVNAYLKAGKIEQAFQLAQSIEIEPNKATLIDESGGSSIEATDTKATAIVNVAKAYKAAGQTKRALELLSQAVQVAQSLKYFEDKHPWDIFPKYPGANKAFPLREISQTYLDIAQEYISTGQIQQMLQVVEAIDHVEGRVLVLILLARNAIDLGQTKQALYILDRAVQIAKTLDNISDRAYTFQAIALEYAAAGKTEQFRRLLLPIFTYLELAKLWELGLEEAMIRESESALQLWQRVLSLCQETGNVNCDAEWMILNGIGSMQTELAQYSQARNSFQKALTIYRETNSTERKELLHRGIGEVYEGLGELSKKLGQYSQSLEYYHKALKIYRDTGRSLVLSPLICQPKVPSTTAYQGNCFRIAVVLNRIGEIHNKLGEYSQALVYLQEALSIGDLSAMDNTNRIGVTLSFMGEAYLRLGQYEKAQEFLQRAASLLIITPEKETIDIVDRFEQVVVLRHLGEAYANTGRYTQAMNYYQKALAISRDIEDRAGEGSTLNNLGNLYNSLGQYADAEQSLFQAVEIWESLRGSELTDENKISLFETQADTYRYLQQALIAQNQTNAALVVAERGRARAFVELLAKQLSPQPNTPPIKPPSLEEIKQIAKQRKATIIQYSIIPEQSLYIWVIQPTGKIDFRSVDLKTWLQQQNRSLADFVTHTRESIGVSRSIFVAEVQYPVNQKEQTQRLQQLHQLLIEPIAELLPTNPEEHVIFIPQGELFLVPFSALQDEADNYLIEKHTILTAPSIQVLELTRQQRKGVRSREWRVGEDKALIVGNPTMPSVPPKIGEEPQQLTNLPGAKQEAEAIAPLFNTKALTGNIATETAVKAKLPQARIIHLATHGLFDDIQGLQSAIALAPTDTDNGLLTASEILDLKLNAELVVLSACNTGRGRLTGDGVIGLSRSLFIAGTPSVIVSLWAVPDAATQELMSEFYRQFKLTGDKAQSLRQAMLQMKDKHPDAPRKWAAFTLIGEAE